MTILPPGAPTRASAERTLYATLMDYLASTLYGAAIDPTGTHATIPTAGPDGIERTYSSATHGFCRIATASPRQAWPTAWPTSESPDLIDVEATYVRSSMMHPRTGELFAAGVEIRMSLTPAPARPRQSRQPVEATLFGEGFSSLSVRLWCEPEAARPLRWRPWQPGFAGMKDRVVATGREFLEDSTTRDADLRTVNEIVRHVFRPHADPFIHHYVTPRYLPVDPRACLKNPRELFLGTAAESIPGRAVPYGYSPGTRQPAPVTKPGAPTTPRATRGSTPPPPPNTPGARQGPEAGLSR